MTTSLDPNHYQSGTDFIRAHAMHIPNLWVSVDPVGITVVPCPMATLPEQYEALRLLAERLSVPMFTSNVQTTAQGRYYANEFYAVYRGVRVTGHQRVSVEQLVAS